MNTFHIVVHGYEVKQTRLALLLVYINFSQYRYTSMDVNNRFLFTIKIKYVHVIE